LSKPETRRCTQFAFDPASGRDLLEIIEVRNAPFVRVRLDHVARRIVSHTAIWSRWDRAGQTSFEKYLSRALGSQCSPAPR